MVARHPSPTVTWHPLIVSPHHPPRRRSRQRTLQGAGLSRNYIDVHGSTKPGVRGWQNVTWLEAVPKGDNDWSRLAILHPDPFDALAGLLAAAWRDTDPILFEVARLRVATLLRLAPEQVGASAKAKRAGLTDAKVAALPAWPSSPALSAREKACLALAEQFVIDANGVTDTQVADVARHLGAPGCYAFVEAVSVLETFYRACQTLQICSGPAIDELLAGAEGEPCQERTP